MKFGLFGDVHSNYEALTAVLEAFERENIDHYVFLGDLVGYGADPGLCIQLFKDLMQKKSCVAVAGNHDYAVAGSTPYKHYTLYARESIEWTQKQLNAAEKEFLASLPLMLRVPAHPQPVAAAKGSRPPQASGHETSFSVVHANLVAPEEWGYIFDIDDVYPNFQILKDQVCFIGHSHKPIVFVSGSHVDWFIDSPVDLKPGTKYIINIGSVGQPRDGNPQASYAVYDTTTARVEIKRVAYDIAKAQNKILKAGLSQILAHRLSVGK